MSMVTQMHRHTVHVHLHEYKYQITQSSTFLPSFRHFTSLIHLYLLYNNWSYTVIQYLYMCRSKSVDTSSSYCQWYTFIGVISATICISPWFISQQRKSTPLPTIYHILSSHHISPWLPSSYLITPVKLNTSTFIPPNLFSSKVISSCLITSSWLPPLHPIFPILWSYFTSKCHPNPCHVITLSHFD